MTILQALDSARTVSPQVVVAGWESTTPESSLSVSQDFLEGARTLVATIANGAIAASNGAAWIGAVPLPGEKRALLDLLGFDLYSGATGIALFLGAFAQLTGSGECRNLALAGLAPWVHQLRGCESARGLATAMGIGGGTGLGSAAYSLVRLGSLLQEPALLEDARSVATLITEQRIDSDRFLDVVAGAAGAIFGLLAVYRACQDRTALEKAVRCGQHLVRNQTYGMQGARAWRTTPGKALTGFSHGAAGIALALLRLYKATDNRVYLSAALEGIAYERSVFSPAHRNWPDFRSESDPDAAPDFPCKWCHGAAGIGLARVSGLNVLDDLEIRDEVRAALEAVAKFPIDAFDHLCCGNFGRVEFLLESGYRLGDRGLIALARQRAHQLLDRAKRHGGFAWSAGNDSQNASFFTGASGVGYCLLRLIDPSALPCAMSWE
jgi:type 2 lantibiotic biosynthesis protein LanM